jgi:hypothetical protein
VRLACVADPSRQFDGWYKDGLNELAESYWPSPRAVAGDGRIFEAGTVVFTGVALTDGRITVDRKKGLAYAESLARGLKKLGLGFDVEVSKALEGQNPRGYFGSACHKAQLETHRAYMESQARW